MGANTRRIEALTSFDALDYLNGFEVPMKELSSKLRTPVQDVVARVESTLAQVKELTSELKKAKTSSNDILPESLDEYIVDAGFPVFVYRKDGLDAGGMRNFWDIVRARLDNGGACVLASDNEGTPLLLAAGSDEAVQAGFNAGAVIKAIASNIKGGGGGKPSMAQAGGKDVAGLDAALEAARNYF